jgi:hypothetical protein
MSLNLLLLTQKELQFRVVSTHLPNSMVYHVSCCVICSKLLNSKMSIETHKEPKRALSFRNILLDPDHLYTMTVMSSKIRNHKIYPSHLQPFFTKTAQTPSPKYCFGWTILEKSHWKRKVTLLGHHFEALSVFGGDNVFFAVFELGLKFRPRFTRVTTWMMIIYLIPALYQQCQQLI